LHIYVIAYSLSTSKGGVSSSGSSAIVDQPSTSQSPMFYQISPPQPLALQPSGEVADNWKLWKEKYNSIISRLDGESSPYRLAMFKEAHDRQ